MSRRELGNLFFVVNDRYVGTIASQVMALLLCRSLFASLLALHTEVERLGSASG